MSDHTNKSNHPNLAFFPDSLIQLNKEVSKHPKLIELLNNHAAPDWEIRLAQICQYCGIAVDGTFDAGGIDYIAEQCIKRLRMREKDTEIIGEIQGDINIIDTTQDIDIDLSLTKNPKIIH